MVRFITHDETLTGDDLFNARGAHQVLLEEADGAKSMRAGLTWLSWGTEDGLDSLPYGEWLYITLIGANFNTDVDAEKFDEWTVSLQCTARLWAAKRASGLNLYTCGDG